MTIAQLRAETGFGECRVRGIIGQLRAAGRVETIFVWREGIDGHQHQAPVYRLVEGK